jgi:hypothetical protein
MNNSQKRTWVEILDIDGFKKINHVINKYSASDKLTEYQAFREELVLTPIKNIKVFATQFGDYKYMILAKLFLDKEMKVGYWIHFDGIAQERDLIKGNQSHAAMFAITCLSDLYNFGEPIKSLPIDENTLEFLTKTMNDFGARKIPYSIKRLQSFQNKDRGSENIL